MTAATSSYNYSAPTSSMGNDSWPWVGPSALADEEPEFRSSEPGVSSKTQVQGGDSQTSAFSLTWENYSKSESNFSRSLSFPYFLSSIPVSSLPSLHKVHALRKRIKGHLRTACVVLTTTHAFTVRSRLHGPMLSGQSKGAHTATFF